MSDDDRVLDTVKVMTLFFLLDGRSAHVAEDMNLEEGKMLYKKLIPTAMGEKLPNRSDPYEWIIYDVFESICACGRELADQVLQGALICVTGQIDLGHLTCPDMGSLLRQRMREAGCAHSKLCHRLPTIQRGAACAQRDAEILEGIHESYSRLAILVNDIYSFDKELHLSNQNHKEEGKLVNMVNQMSIDAGISYSTAKRILWVLCRELEIENQEIVAKVVASVKGGADPTVKMYPKGVEYVLGGNEYWSETTERYHWRD